MACSSNPERGAHTPDSPPISNGPRPVDPATPDAGPPPAPPPEPQTPPPPEPPTGYPEAQVFPPAFEQELPGSRTVAQRTTFRFRVPVARAGERLSFVFVAGDDALRIHAATVARADANGALASAPVALSFQGAPGATLTAHHTVHSDPVALSVSFREELAVSFEVDGAIAQGQADLFPQSYAAEGAHASAPERFGQPQGRLVGLGGIEVEGTAARTVMLIGGGLAAGKGAPTGDYRDTWPAVAERLLGAPVLNVSQEGLGVDAALTALDAGTLKLTGVSDCLVMLGGDEATTTSSATLQTSLDALLSRLRAHCNVYAGTLPPQGVSTASGTPDATARRAMNDWLRSAVPAPQVVDFDALLRDPSNPEHCQSDMQDGAGVLSERAQVRMGAEVARRLGGAPPEERPRTMTTEVTHSDSSHDVLAVDASGTVYAVKNGAGRSRLWASTDNARSFKPRGMHPTGSAFQVMTALKDGTLLADTQAMDGTHAIARSIDHGATWSNVLPLGLFRMLQPGNIRELHGTLFFGEYQVFAEESPVRIWASTDRGATWKVRATLQGRRHCHSLVADPEQGVLWAMMGDLHGGLLRSVDDGVTWKPVLDGPTGVAVDGIITPRGLLFGTDNLYRPPVPVIRRVGTDDEVAQMKRLPGPSYSVLRLRNGGYLMGTTRETSGDVYADGDVSAHLFASADGVSWTELTAYPRMFPDDYARADVYWELSSGEALLKLTNVEGIGTGFQLLKSTLH
ncbi:hypothetical protein JGU66_12040 [Myxococcaceae bacterium JPH2]|nr:hypothetical protein [Myxococcaceae bacterium JPH2]